MSRRTLGRIIATLVGVEWFVLLLFAGLGLVFGPMAWVAALVGGRRPRAAAVLLGLPVIVLFLAAVPLMFDRTARLSLLDAAGFLAVLALPAILAAALIAAASGGHRDVPASEHAEAPASATGHAEPPS